MARPPIVLVARPFSYAGHFAGWTRLFSKAGFECHAPSLPGHAPSDPSALGSLTLDDYLAALHGGLSKLVAPPIIVGHSMGGLLAQQLAAIIPCEALICVASGRLGCCSHKSELWHFLRQLCRQSGAAGARFTEQKRRSASSGS